MRIGAVGFQMYQPYIYNTNTVSGKSLSKVNPIGDDLLSSGTDFSGMTDEEQQNLNPLRRGETANFADVIAMQMQMGRMNADKIMKPAAEEAQPIEEDRDAVRPLQTGASLYQLQRASFAYQMNMIA
ncbi:MAG: hypothetical protein NC123_10300 [Butyrivibrio sp.]|nr:hypothetical protein [Acetatifactor muris]MCM1559922.1 hypothetical protein [Butyrivibrio sp.]